MLWTGRDDGLFRAAIGQSGFGGVLSRFPGGANNTEAMDALYNLFVSNTSCASTANTSASLNCLRALPFDEINAALNGTEAAPWPPMLDGDFSEYHTPTRQASILGEVGTGVSLRAVWETSGAWQLAQLTGQQSLAANPPEPMSEIWCQSLTWPQSRTSP